MRIAVRLVLLSFGSVAFGHRLDEYLQATTISIEKNRIQAQIRLTPGVAVFRYVVTIIDTDHDGVISKTEQRTYAELVLGDLSLSVDGDRLRVQLVSTAFPRVEQMMEGLGDILVDFAADIPGDRKTRKLVFENHHQSPIATYLVNCLVPRDPDIRIAAQNRNYEQALYQLEYTQNGGRAEPLSLTWWSDGRGWLSLVGLVLLVRLAVVLRRS